MMRRIATIVSMAAVMSLTVVACGSDPTPTPNPTPTPTSAPAATPTPTPEPTAVTATFNMLLNMGAFGQVSVGIRDMIEAGTDGRITIEHQDEPTLSAVVQLIERRPESYPRLLFQLSEITQALWGQGIDPDGSGIINPVPQALYGIFPIGCLTLYTRNPDVHTIYDLDGKRLYPGRVGSSMKAAVDLLVDAADIDVTIIQGTGGGQDAQLLSDQEVDAAASGIIFGASPPPQLNQVAAVTKDLYIVDIPDEVRVAALARNPEWGAASLFESLRIEPGDLERAAGAGYQLVRQPLDCIGGITVTIHTSPEVEDEVTYEMVRAILDNRDMADESFPFIARPWKNQLGLSFQPQDQYHPGARRAYEEVGVQYGLEGIRAQGG